MFWTIIGTLIGGIIIGALARLILPGRQAMPWWLTIVVGVVAMIIGRVVAGFFGVATTPGVDWIRWAITIVIGVVLVAIVAAIYPKMRGGSTSTT
ncbi:GlsB/YeaQ/YmgE family stress response membrane protein [Fodinicola acaciae]|uniref:GlsB/YeaQ/YmgE family stress response membrane protein n=1 Tax=Fodinicola acaciae TaxID=2681555 RepID=UPI0013D5A265|nr:GlsB/YeaQ/YmgE family stress response membrane protein [Fodinicola acaciae]